MNLVLLDDGDLTADGGAVLHGARARHVHQVHRAAVGDTLKVGLVGGQVGEGVVTRVAPDESCSERLRNVVDTPSGGSLG